MNSSHRPQETQELEQQRIESQQGLEQVQQYSKSVQQALGDTSTTLQSAYRLLAIVQDTQLSLSKALTSAAEPFEQELVPLLIQGKRACAKLAMLQTSLDALYGKVAAKVRATASCVASVATKEACAARTALVTHGSRLLQREHEGLKLRRAGLEGQLEHLHRRQHTAEAQLQTCKQQLQESQAQAAELQSKHTSAKSEAVALQAKLDQEDTALQGMKQGLATTLEQAAEMKKQEVRQEPSAAAAGHVHMYRIFPGCTAGRT